MHRLVDRAYLTVFVLFVFLMVKFGSISSHALNCGMFVRENAEFKFQ